MRNGNGNEAYDRYERQIETTALYACRISDAGRQRSQRALFGRG